MKCHISLLVVAVGLCDRLTPVIAARPDSAEKTLEGIVANMQENMAVCTDENLPKLLACMSDEMPNRQLFVQTVSKNGRRLTPIIDSTTSKYLEHSNAPHARTEFPYAVAMITQTVTRVAYATRNWPTGWALSKGPRFSVPKCFSRKSVASGN